MNYEYLYFGSVALFAYRTFAVIV